MKKRRLTLNAKISLNILNSNNTKANNRRTRNKTMSRKRIDKKICRNSKGAKISRRKRMQPVTMIKTTFTAKKCRKSPRLTKHLKDNRRKNKKKQAKCRLSLNKKRKKTSKKKRGPINKWRKRKASILRRARLRSRRRKKRMSSSQSKRFSPLTSPKRSRRQANRKLSQKTKPTNLETLKSLLQENPRSRRHLSAPHGSEHLSLPRRSRRPQSTESSVRAKSSFLRKKRNASFSNHTSSNAMKIIKSKARKRSPQSRCYTKT